MCVPEKQIILENYAKPSNHDSYMYIPVALHLSPPGQEQLPYDVLDQTQWADVHHISPIGYELPCPLYTFPHLILLPSGICHVKVNTTIGPYDSYVLSNLAMSLGVHLLCQ